MIMRLKPCESVPIPDSIGVKANNEYTVTSISLAKHMTKFESKTAMISFVTTDPKVTEFLLFAILDDRDSVLLLTGGVETISGTTLPALSACTVSLEEEAGISDGRVCNYTSKVRRVATSNRANQYFTSGAKSNPQITAKKANPAPTKQGSANGYMRQNSLLNSRRQRLSGWARRPPIGKPTVCPMRYDTVKPVNAMFWFDLSGQISARQTLYGARLGRHLLISKLSKHYFDGPAIACQ